MDRIDVQAVFAALKARCPKSYRVHIIFDHSDNTMIVPAATLGEAYQWQADAFKHGEARDVCVETWLEEVY